MRLKLNLLILLLVTLVLLISGVFSYFRLRAELDAGFEESKQDLAQRLQVNLANALWHYDADQAANVIEAELLSPDIRAIHVYRTTFLESEGKPKSVLLVSRAKNPGDRRSNGSPEGGAAPDTMHVQLRPHHSGTPGGSTDRASEINSVEIVFSRAHVAQMLERQLRFRLAEIVVINLLLGGMLFALVSRMVTTPLMRLSSAFKELARSPQARSLSVKGKDEFGEVVDAFNQIERRLTSDIAQRQAAEEQLRASNKDLTQALETIRLAQESLVQSEKFASLGSLVAGVAHEINTPVGVAVTGSSYLLEEARNFQKLMQDGAIKKSEFLQFINAVSEGAQLVLNNAERAAHLIQSFKQVAADETSEARRTFDLAGYLNEVLTSLRPKYKKTQVRISASCPEDIRMDTYPGLLTQVLTNLITNAQVHGFDEGEAGEITVSACSQGAFVKIECANNGKPILPENLTKIFEPFFTTRRAAGGTGLGLNIVFNIVTQRLGGTIHVCSDTLETRFVISIPKVLGDEKQGGTEHGQI